MTLPYTAQSLKVGVIGGGAAGLATARVLSRNGISPVVLEQGDSVGGVWMYRAATAAAAKENKSHPMYAGLRTNLPKEVMQYREKPWIGTSSGDDKSYLTHKQVLEYLRDYMNQFDLEKYISYNSKVTQLTMLTTTNDEKDCDDDDDKSDDWPKIQLTWESNNNAAISTETFDAVCICNGHYAKASSPNIDGIDTMFRGRVLHSIEYDDPTEFANQTVLCIGARASGSDLAREISQYAKHVYLSDSTANECNTCNTVTVVPRTVGVLDGNRVEFANNCDLSPSVDVIIFCSGYDYSFPFINEKSNLYLVVGQRRVMPLYEQLWHAEYPSLTFIGLPHSVVPFPMFELQAEAVVAQLLDHQLPPRSVRMAKAQEDATKGGPRESGRVEDTHYLGDAQWDYSRTLAKLAGLYNGQLEKYIVTSEKIYNHASRERGSLFPGGSDAYRSTCYVRDDDNHQRFQITASEMEDAALP